MGYIFCLRYFFLFFNLFLARLAKLPIRLYILPMFFLYFFIFLMVDFGDPVAQNLMDRYPPKFKDW